MSIQSEINRIKTDKENLITSLREKGIEIADGATLGDISIDVGETEVGIDTSDATATANEIFEGETAYVNGEKITGNFTIENEVTTQTELINQIKTALENRAIGGSDSNGNISISESEWIDITSLPTTYKAITPTYTTFYLPITFNTISVIINGIFASRTGATTSISKTKYYSDGTVEWSSSGTNNKLYNLSHITDGENNEFIAIEYLSTAISSNTQVYAKLIYANEQVNAYVYD